MFVYFWFAVASFVCLLACSFACLLACVFACLFVCLVRRLFLGSWLRLLDCLFGRLFICLFVCLNACFVVRLFVFVYYRVGVRVSLFARLVGRVFVGLFGWLLDCRLDKLTVGSCVCFWSCACVSF